MKKKLNVIQIKGVRGLIMAVGVVSCLFAGFVVFPGWVGMNIWNLISTHFYNFPQIGLVQGVLLWGIIATTYMIFRKEKLIVCMKAPQGLTDDELKEVFADMKKQSLEDPILQAMMKAREAELKYKAQQELENKNTETEHVVTSTTSDNSNLN